MAIKLERINYKDDSNIIFKDLNINIPYNKIIGLYGDFYQYFVSLLKNKEFNTGKITDDSFYLDNVLQVEFDSFITNYVNDELYLRLDYNEEIENKVLSILKMFGYNKDFLNNKISLLSSSDKKLLWLIIISFDNNKVLILEDLFSGVDYYHKSLFIKLIKSIKRNSKKLIFIKDNDINTISNIVDSLLIVDSHLIMLDECDNIFNNENISNVEIRMPDFIKLKHLLIKKGVDVENIKTINDLLGE